MFRFLLAAIIAAFLLPAAPAAAAPLAQRTEAFEAAACMFELPAGAPEELFECGYLTVPARHAEPDGPTIRLAVAILPAQTTPRQPDPLVMLQGGPGGSTIDTYTQALLLPNGQRLRADRDIILFDQRGTLYSEPSLVCTEEQELIERTIEQDLEYEETERLSLEAVAACRERLTRDGVDLSAFDSVENAADVEALRVALGYEQINLYGVSYGTLLALHVMRDHPAGLRSVILDAVVPTQTNFIAEVPRSQNRAFGELFVACAADPQCNRAFPDLERRTFALAETLDRQPARVPVTDSETNRSYQMVMDGETFLGLMFQLLYASEVLPALPLVVAQTEAGEYTFLSRIASVLVFDRTLATGMYYSVICAEDADFTAEDVSIEGVRPPFAEGARRDADALLRLCADWAVEPLPASVDTPVTSEIPTLVLNGRFDPITPPAFGEQAAETLPNSFLFTFGNTGHGAATAGECPASIMLAFLDDPTSEPDSSCIAENPAPEFLTPSNLVVTPALNGVLGWLEGRNLWQLGLLAVALGLLLTSLLVYPIAWLVRLAGGRTRPRQGNGLARWLAPLSAILAVVFIIGLVVVVIQQAVENELVLLFGVPVSSWPLFVLPPLLALLTLGMAVLALRGLVSRGADAWPVWDRGYFALLTIAAVVFVGLLASLGFVTALV